MIAFASGSVSSRLYSPTAPALLFRIQECDSLLNASSVNWNWKIGENVHPAWISHSRVRRGARIAPPPRGQLSCPPHNPPLSAQNVSTMDARGVTRLSKVDPADGKNPRDTKTFLLLSGPNHNLFGERDPKQ